MNTREHKQSLYKTSRWRKLRLLALRRDKYLCQYCLQLDMVTPGNVVDHIQRHHGDKELFFDIDNLQILCDDCHRIVKAREENLADKMNVDSIRIGCDVDGMPFN